MNSAIYNFSCYRDYLQTSLPKVGVKRGVRGHLAKFLNCRGSHISQVLSGQSHLSLEMAQKVCDFFGWSKSESHFFLLLVQKSRAGTHKLSQYFEEQMNQIKNAQKEVKKNMIESEELDKHHAEVYYSSWHYAAIHILCSTSNVKTFEDIQSKLNLPSQTIKLALNFLIESNIIAETEGALGTTGKRIHIGDNKQLVSRNHCNWRMKACDKINFSNLDDLHFTGVYSLSEKDHENIKNNILKLLRRTNQIVKHSPPESMSLLCLDWFELS